MGAKSYEAATKALTAHGSKSGKKHRVSEIRVRRAKGGYIASHTAHEDEHGNPVFEGGPNAEHVLADMAAVHDHLDEHMGGGDEEAEG